MLMYVFIGGEQNKETVDEAALFLLRLFLCESLVSQKHLLMLKQMFGSVSSNLAGKVCQVKGIFRIDSSTSLRQNIVVCTVQNEKL
jgi:hypothetical protein